MEPRTWQSIRDEKRKQQKEAIPGHWRLEQYDIDFRSSLPVIESCGILDQKELQITSETAGVILDKIHSGMWTASEVTVAYCKRAVVLHQLVGCCTEMMIERAIRTAKELDDHFAKTRKLVGPLHGLPMSLKDSQDIEGYDSSLGWAATCFKPAKQDGLVSELTVIKLGAIPFVKSNIPQSLMMSDSYNHIFGQSLNSLNRDLISGGSSGGEGALVGALASPIGIGTDIGGSIRIPAACQGIYGLCPSRHRIPNLESDRHQKHLVPPVAGPLTASLSTLTTYMSAYISTSPWLIDPTLTPLPWRSALLTPPMPPLRIAFIHDDGVVLPQPPITRALHHLRNLFTSSGHTTLTWPHTPTHSAAYSDLWLPSVLADGGKRCASLCASGHNQPLIQGMLVGQPSDYMDVAAREAHAEKILTYRREYQEWWRESAIDALITPVMPWVGLRPKQWVESNQYVGYSSFVNLLDYAALAVPTGIVVDREKDNPQGSLEPKAPDGGPNSKSILSNWNSHTPRNPSDAYNHGQYDISLVEGMPVSVQIVGGRYGEETCVMVAGVIEEMRRKVGQEG